MTTSTPGRSFSTRQRNRHSRGAENTENDVIRAVGRKSEEEKEALVQADEK